MIHTVGRVRASLHYKDGKFIGINLSVTESKDIDPYDVGSSLSHYFEKDDLYNLAIFVCTYCNKVLEKKGINNENIEDSNLLIRRARAKLQEIKNERN